jgi:hypothetical protein
VLHKHQNGRGWTTLCIVAFAAALALGAGSAPAVRLDSWDTAGPGPLNLSGDWHSYPPGADGFKHPPAIVMDEGRPALQFGTGGDSIRLGRSVSIDARKTPWLNWEWKPLALPTGGDVRDPKRNDQAGRVMVAFEGMKMLVYVWDTTAPVGSEVDPDEFTFYRRILIVVRSGSEGVGRWSAERRNVHADYRRLFRGEPGQIKLVGLESHSDDTRSRTSILFGRIHFEAQ